jgi:hypothetical protein
MHRKLIVMTLAIAVGLIATGSASGDAPKDAARTKVQIGAYSYPSGGDPAQFQVEVISKKLKCKKGRKVTMYRDDPGGPVKLGSSKAISGEGTWVAIIEDDDKPSENAYYASAPAENGCEKARSKNYFLTN